jgi:hypothetical protein
MLTVRVAVATMLVVLEVQSLECWESCSFSS